MFEKTNSIVTLPETCNSIDLGCGSKKRPGTWGVDHYGFPGVDQIIDLDKTPWPLPENRFDFVFASHIIEHVLSVPEFMKEIHRISSNNAIITIITPHFSSVNSYKDPTHRWHLASDWYSVFTESYLSSHIPLFEHVRTEIIFGKNIFNVIPKTMVKLRGIKAWEKKFSFIFNARNIFTSLRVIKDQ
jgi:ubiquinone/menaquinone biosynthesis C-methylase UbiE